MNRLAAGQLIVCTGIRMNPECARAIAELGPGWQANNRQFVMSEWLAPDQFRRAALLWIVDDSAPWGDVRFALSHRIPLLVPENNALMKQVCVSANCGLWYRDEVGVRLCLDLLLANDTVREDLGENGRAYGASSKVSARSQHNLAAHTDSHSGG